MQSPLMSDSKLMSLTNRLGELILLNFCFLLCCLPVVTIGAASSALYTVCFRFGTSREKGTVGSFFRAFWANLKQGIILWLILASVCLFAVYFVLVFLAQGGAIHYAYIPFLVLLALALMVSGYAFPLLSQFENTTRQTLKNAFILSLAYLPRSLVIAVLNILPLVLLLAVPMAFLWAGIFWVFLYFSVAAYCNTLLLRKVFAPFLPEETEEE